MERTDSRATVGRLLHGEAGPGEQLRDEPADVRIVVDDEHTAFAHTCFIPGPDRLPYAR